MADKILEINRMSTEAAWLLDLVYFLPYLLADDLVLHGFFFVCLALIINPQSAERFQLWKAGPFPQEAILGRRGSAQNDKPEDRVPGQEPEAV